jgi:hypothetical protein
VTLSSSSLHDGVRSSLTLSSNELSGGLPFNIGSLALLTSLNVDHNRLDDAPLTLLSLVNLRCGRHAYMCALALSCDRASAALQDTVAVQQLVFGDAPRVFEKRDVDNVSLGAHLVALTCASHTALWSCTAGRCDTVSRRVLCRASLARTARPPR